MSDLEIKARARIGELRQEIEMLEGYLRISEEARALLEQRVTRENHPQGSFAVSTIVAPRAFHNDGPVPESPRQRVNDNPRPAVLIPAVIEILREKGEPMSRRELHEALSERGLVVRGAEPTKTLGTILWRAKEQIDSIEGRGYWPKGDSVPPSGDLDELLS